MSDAPNSLPVTIFSFGYKYLPPQDVNLLFDVRFLRNPYHVKELRSSTGQVAEIAAYVLENEAGRKCLQQLQQTTLFFARQLQRENKEALRVAIGCTGGHHRSVAVTEALSELLKKDFPNTSHHHRDILKESH